MILELRRSFELLERRKAAALSYVADWSSAQLQFRPEPACWCALDVLDHLVKVESRSLAAVRSGLPSGHPLVLKDRLGALLVLSVMRSPLRVKVPPASTAVLPGETTDPAAIAERWTETRHQLEKLLQALTPEQLRCGLFRHPVSGWMTISTTMGFLSAHLRHHGYQLKRLRRAAGR